MTDQEFATLKHKLNLASVGLKLAEQMIDLASNEETLSVHEPRWKSSLIAARSSLENMRHEMSAETVKSAKDWLNQHLALFSELTETTSAAQISKANKDEFHAAMMKLAKIMADLQT